MDSQRIITEANKWVGTRWHHQGRSRAGVDCIGLLVCVARGLGLPVMDETDYSHQPDGHRLQAALDNHMLRIAAPEPGAVLLMKFTTNPQHVAIMADKSEIIHAYGHARRVVRHQLDATWAGRVVCCYRFPGVQT
jgi:NlpC/P60 family putative phage cell wall peptidase